MQPWYNAVEYFVEELTTGDPLPQFVASWNKLFLRKRRSYLSGFLYYEFGNIRQVADNKSQGAQNVCFQNFVFADFGGGGCMKNREGELYQL